MSCPICANSVSTIKDDLTNRLKRINCSQCGQFSMHENAIDRMRTVTADERWKISAWVSEFAPEVVSSADIDLARACVVPSLHHRADRMLRWLATQFPPSQFFTRYDLGNLNASPGFVDLNDESEAGMPVSPLTPIGWNRSFDEMWFVVTEVLLKEMGLLAVRQRDGYHVSAKGLLYLEGRRETVSAIGFCAMWFNEEVRPLWTDVIAPATQDAGYEALRIDSKQHNGKIDDEIMASIRASRFVVADFTGSRGGVYYEAGFAHGLGLPVIFMCREGEELHFDVRQYNCIFWKPERLDEAHEALKNRILATLGQGPKAVPSRR